MKPSIKNIKKSTPITAKKIGGMFAAISAGIGSYGYIYDMDVYAHIGAICLVLSIVIPNLFTDETENSK
jgi:hypothetical protein